MALPDARIPCPQCGGAIHPIAGRCKHCKADVAALRTDRPQAAAALPPLVAHGPAYVPTPEAILPPRPTGPMPVVPSGARWPLVVIGLSVVAAATAIGVLVWPSPGAGAAEKPAATQRAAAAEKPGDPPAQKAQPTGDVRPPTANDLADYTSSLPKYGQLQAQIDTQFGTVHCVLYPDKAPLAVANFVGLATGKKPWLDTSGQVQKGKPFYDGLTFHRVIAEFMIQGGDPLGTGTGGPGYTFENEISDLVMEPGSLAMANAGPGTNGSQFFIMENEAAHLNGKHTIFGKCTDLAVVKRIARVPKSSMDKPVENVTMTVTITK